MLASFAWLVKAASWSLLGITHWLIPCSTSKWMLRNKNRCLFGASSKSLQIGYAQFNVFKIGKHFFGSPLLGAFFLGDFFTPSGIYRRSSQDLARSSVANPLRRRPPNSIVTAFELRDVTGAVLGRASL